MDKIIGDKTIHPETLAKIRERGGAWAAYQNVALDSADLGHLQFLQYGSERTFKAPPAAMPDTPAAIGWRYRHVGFVDLARGEVTTIEPEGDK